MKKKFSINHRARSFRFAFNGIVYLIKHEPNAWIHLAITIVVIIAGLLLELHAAQWCLVTLAIGIVWMAESMNSAIEKLVDRISPEKMSGQAG